jgi:FixJ family two-component response regulator
MTATGDPRRFVVAVVDDDRSVLDSLEMLLASADYDVRVFASAPALLESGGLREIDCLISDVGMPVMDGFELARTVHAARPELPVILISGRPDLLNRSRRDVPGQHRLFKKPFSGPELLTTIGDALRAAQRRTPGS